MIHEILPVGPLQCNCSVIGDETTHEAMVIDPGDDIDDVLALVSKHNLRVKQIVITHAHIDHVGGAMKLRAATGAPILLNQNDYALLKMLDAQAAWIGMRSPAKSKSTAASATATKSPPAPSKPTSSKPPATPKAASASSFSRKVRLEKMNRCKTGATPHVALTDARPGDLLFFYPGITHVGIYLGDGLMVDAPHLGALVRVEPFEPWFGPVMGVGRPA